MTSEKRVERAVVAFALSALTIFGGHFYYKRWTRAGLFGTFLFAWMLLFPMMSSIVVIYFMPFRFELPITRGAIHEIWSVGLLVLCIASGVVAAHDARYQDEETDHDERFSRWVSALGLSALGALVVFSSPVFWKNGPLRLAIGSMTDHKQVVTSVPEFHPREMYLGTTMSFSGTFDLDSEKELARGRGKIMGNARVDGTPLTGLRLRLLMNADLKTGWVETGTDGIYKVSVPAAKYVLAGWEIDTESAQKVLPGKIYIRSGLGSEGEILQVDERTPGKGPDLRFATPVTAISPRDVVNLEGEVTFSWEPFPGATEYSLQLMDWGPAGSSLAGHRGTGVLDCSNPPNPVRATKVSLSALRASLKARHAYSWHVEAHDTSGQVISQSPDTSFTTR